MDTAVMDMVMAMDMVTTHPNTTENGNTSTLVKAMVTEKDTALGTENAIAYGSDGIGDWPNGSTVDDLTTSLLYRCHQCLNYCILLLIIFNKLL